jgi:uncharacterized protein (UPF0333 family)
MLGMIPLPYKLLAGAALMAGIFVFGYMKGSAYAEAELARFSAQKSAQIAELEKKNSEISTRVVTEYVDRVNTIREKEYVYRDVVKNSVPTQHDMSNGWVYTHDLSATSGDADSARASDASPSGITDTTALLSIIGNYSKCQANAEQLSQLQQWIILNKEAVDAMAKEKKK